MNCANNHLRILPIGRVGCEPRSGRLLTPRDFNDLERCSILHDPLTAYSAATVYLKEFQCFDDREYLDAAILCYQQAAQLANPLSSQDWRDTETLLTSFDSLRGQETDTGGLNLLALSNLINSAEVGATDSKITPEAVPGTTSRLPRMHLLRYVVTGWNEDFNQAVSMWTLEAKENESTGNIEHLTIIYRHLTAAHLQKSSKYERNGDVVQGGLAWPQKSVDYGNGLHDRDKLESLLLLAVAYEQRFHHHKTRDDLQQAIRICGDLLDCHARAGDLLLRIQYEFGRLITLRGISDDRAEVVQEGLSHLQRAIEYMPRADPAWQRCH